MEVKILELTLQVFGLFWMVGGVFAFRQAQMADLIDNALESLTLEKEDRLINRFLFIGSILTFFSGLGLFLLSKWVLIPIIFLVGSQLVYFMIKQQQRKLAKTEEEKQEAEINPSTINAFWISVVVAIASVISLKLGLLR
jgi:hypothetical protein